MSIFTCPTCDFVNSQKEALCSQCKAPLTQDGYKQTIRKFVIWAIIGEVPFILGIIAISMQMIDLLLLLTCFLVGCIVTGYAVVKILIRHRAALGILKKQQSTSGQLPHKTSDNVTTQNPVFEPDQGSFMVRKLEEVNSRIFNFLFLVPVAVIFPLVGLGIIGGTIFFISNILTGNDPKEFGAVLLLFFLTLLGAVIFYMGIRAGKA